ncbi:MAG TPA: hypothetical protein VG273_05440 [Bryobacteraceae bacterium]|nr:hypothetical protein [Bryobacteraceae bacterium]
MLCVAVFGIGISVIVSRYEQQARAKVVEALQKQFAVDVTLGSLHLSVFPALRATGENLVVRLAGRTDLPPLIVAKRFVVKAALAGFLRHPNHIASVVLSGLEIHIPPKPDRPEHNGGASPKRSFVIDRIVADGSLLEILPRDVKKNSLRFDLRKLDLSSAGSSSTGFHAELINALPPGLIRTDGHLGAWVADDPGGTAVSGEYTFRDADLGVFHGIKGTLSSDGKYQGELSAIEVQGTTDVPDFVLDVAGNPVHLRTTFVATVDGTNGDTDLHPAHAVLGNSAFEVSGSIERGAVAQGKEIDLSAKSEKGSLQDYLRLAVKGNPPPMTGNLTFESQIRIPPGPEPVVEKLKLYGRFRADTVKFTSPDVKEKVADLSHRAEGEPKDHDPEVSGYLSGRFILDHGTLSLPRLVFDVPGAKVNLDGTYTLAGGEIDFHGTARLDATVSEMTTGIKSLLLKPVDPLFKHDGAGAVVPIVISGTRGSPSFRLDIGRALRRLNKITKY